MYPQVSLPDTTGRLLILFARPFVTIHAFHILDKFYSKKVKKQMALHVQFLFLFDTIGHCDKSVSVCQH